MSLVTSAIFNSPWRIAPTSWPWLTAAVEVASQVADNIMALLRLSSNNGINNHLKVANNNRVGGK
jgi:hypothetical protein